MRYLRIPQEFVTNIADLEQLMWPSLDCDTIIHGTVHMVPETHPNITFIMLKLPKHDWYDDTTGPYYFIRYGT